MLIPIARPFIPPEAADEVAAVLKSNWVGQGPRVDEFEETFARCFGLDKDHCIAVSSGSAALELAYDLVGIGPGDLVATTPFTCTATNIPLVRRGARLWFMDIRSDTLNAQGCLDIPERPAALVNVHMHGIESVPECPYDVPIIHDAAQALGIFRGPFTACSFQAIKHITTGDGGLLWCEHREDADKARLLRWFGIDRRKKLANNWQAYKDRKILFDIDYAGHKFQMNDIAAALGIVGLRYYTPNLLKRSQMFSVYRDAGLPVVDGPNNKYGYCCLLVEDRDEFARIIAQSGIETNIMHVRNDAYSLFAPFRRRLPMMDWVEQRYICIPLHMQMTMDDVRYVSDAAKQAINQINDVPWYASQPAR